MATGSGRGRGRPKRGDGHDSNGSGVVDTGLPLQPSDAQRSGWDSRLWDNGLQQDECSPAGNGNGGSADGAQRDYQGRTHDGDSGGLCIGGERDGQDGQRSKTRSLSGVEILEHTELPHVPDGYWKSSEKAAARTPKTRLCDGDGVLVSDNGAALDRIVTLALHTLENVMLTDTPHPEDEAFGRILSAKKDAAVSVLNAGLKADENRFRKHKNNILKDLFEKMQQEKLLIVQ